MVSPSLRPWLLLPPEGSPSEGLKRILIDNAPFLRVDGVLLAPDTGWDPRVGVAATGSEVLFRVVPPALRFGSVSPEGRRMFRDAVVGLFSAVLIPDDATTGIPPEELRLTALQGETALTARQNQIPVLLWTLNNPGQAYSFGDILLSGSVFDEEGPPPYRALIPSTR